MTSYAHSCRTQLFLRPMPKLTERWRFNSLIRTRRSSLSSDVVAFDRSACTGAGFASVLEVNVSCYVNSV